MCQSVLPCTSGKKLVLNEKDKIKRVVYENVTIGVVWVKRTPQIPGFTEVTQYCGVGVRVMVVQTYISIFPRKSFIIVLQWCRIFISGPILNMKLVRDTETSGCGKSSSRRSYWCFGVSWVSFVLLNHRSYQYRSVTIIEYRRPPDSNPSYLSFP